MNLNPERVINEFERMRSAYAPTDEEDLVFFSCINAIKQMEKKVQPYDGQWEWVITDVHDGICDVEVQCPACKHTNKRRCSHYCPNCGNHNSKPKLMHNEWCNEHGVRW